MKGILVLVIGFISFGAFAIVDADLPSNTQSLMEYERNNLAKVTFIRISNSSDLTKHNLTANIYVNKNLRGQLVQEGLSTLYFCPGTYPLVSLLQDTAHNQFPDESTADQNDMIYTFLPGKEYYFILNDRVINANVYQEQLVSTNTALMQIKALSREYPMTNFFQQVNDNGYVSCEKDKSPIHHILTLLPSEPVEISEPLPLKASVTQETQPLMYKGLAEVSSDSESGLDFSNGAKKTFKPVSGDTLIINFDTNNPFLMDNASFNKLVSLLRTNHDLSIDMVVYGDINGTRKERKEFANQRAHIVLNALRNNGIMYKRIAKVRSVVDFTQKLGVIKNPDVLVTIKSKVIAQVVAR